MLFRSARAMVNRDTYMLTSRDHGMSFTADKLHGWSVGACQMSTYALATTGERTFAAWETAGQVHWLSVDSASGRRSAIVAPDGPAGGRKHPSIAATDQGQVLLVWTEGTGWNKGGRLAWQRFDAAGVRTARRGDVAGVATWSLGAAAALPDGRFAIVYESRRSGTTGHDRSQERADAIMLLVLLGIEANERKRVSRANGAGHWGPR